MLKVFLIPVRTVGFKNMHRLELKLHFTGKNENIVGFKWHDQLNMLLVLDEWSIRVDYVWCWLRACS